jgi:hypothetical protein
MTLPAAWARNEPDGFVRETFSVPRQEARARGKAFLKSYPMAAYMNEVERWCELPNGAIEFTLRRLRTAEKFAPSVLAA